MAMSEKSIGEYTVKHARTTGRKVRGRRIWIAKRKSAATWTRSRSSASVITSLSPGLRTPNHSAPPRLLMHSSNGSGSRIDR